MLSQRLGVPHHLPHDSDGRCQVVLCLSRSTLRTSLVACACSTRLILSDSGELALCIKLCLYFLWRRVYVMLGLDCI